MDEHALTESLRQRVDKLTLTDVARQLGISKQYLCDVLAGRKAPGPKIFAALGVTKRVTFTKAK